MGKGQLSSRKQACTATLWVKEKQNKTETFSLSLEAVFCASNLKTKVKMKNVGLTTAQGFCSEVY